MLASLPKQHIPKGPVALFIRPEGQSLGVRLRVRCAAPPTRGPRTPPAPLAATAWPLSHLGWALA